MLKQNFTRSFAPLTASHRHALQGVVQITQIFPQGVLTPLPVRCDHTFSFFLTIPPAVTVSRRFNIGCPSPVRSGRTNRWVFGTRML